MHDFFFFLNIYRKIQFQLTLNIKIIKLHNFNRKTQVEVTIKIKNGLQKLFFLTKPLHKRVRILTFTYFFISF